MHRENPWEGKYAIGIAVLGLTIPYLPNSIVVLHVQQQEPAKMITEPELKTAINSQLDVNECESLDQIHIGHLEYYGFIEDGQEEAVVIASTCMTGTAGPDVHAVYKRDGDGKVVELPFRHVEGDPFFNCSGWKIPVFGNPNYELAVENGGLVARRSDASDREAPLVVWYKWDGKKFVMDHMKVAGPFPPSYDCAKATKKLDRANMLLAERSGPRCTARAGLPCRHATTPTGQEAEASRPTTRMAGAAREGMHPL
jgi:hypothetical protein